MLTYLPFAYLFVYVVVLLLKLGALMAMLPYMLAAQFRTRDKILGQPSSRNFRRMCVVFLWFALTLQALLWPLVLFVERWRFFTPYNPFAVMREVARTVQRQYER